MAAIIHVFNPLSYNKVCCILLLMNNRLEGLFISKHFINMSLGCMVTSL